MQVPYKSTLNGTKYTCGVYEHCANEAPAKVQCLKKKYETMQETDV